jgi:CopG family transcriptional regulator, nickel-responsive regulator
MTTKTKTKTKKKLKPAKSDEKLVRFGVSLPEELHRKFDRHIELAEYSNRSEAIRDLIRNELVQKEWLEGEVDVAGTITVVYDHHTRGLTSSLVRLQHDFHDTILSTQHIHLDHDNCLEVIIVRGKAGNVRKLADRLKSTRGVKHCRLTATTTGKNLN